MKREIFCKPCAITHRLGMRRKYGTSMASYYCDFCMDKLPKGTAICCASYFRSPDEYYPWEDEYIEPKPSSEGMER